MRCPQPSAAALELWEVATALQHKDSCGRFAFFGLPVSPLQPCVPWWTWSEQARKTEDPRNLDVRC